MDCTLGVQAQCLEQLRNDCPTALRRCATHIQVQDHKERGASVAHLRKDAVGVAFHKARETLPRRRPWRLLDKGKTAKFGGHFLRKFGEM